MLTSKLAKVNTILRLHFFHGQNSSLIILFLVKNGAIFQAHEYWILHSMLAKWGLCFVYTNTPWRVCSCSICTDTSQISFIQSNSEVRCCSLIMSANVSIFPTTILSPCQHCQHISYPSPWMTKKYHENKICELNIKILG